MKSSKEVKLEIAKRFFEQSILSEDACLRFADIAIEVFTKHIHETIEESKQTNILK